MYNPTADIAVNGNRLKKYSGQNIYLKDGTEFQIELNNPTQDVYKAMIELNGKLISTAGLVLNPGQHFYLDRFIDENEKFLFETYDVPNSRAVKKAIQKNGLVKILFYKEQSKVDFNKVWIDYSKIVEQPKVYPPYETTPWFYSDHTVGPFFNTTTGMNSVSCCSAKVKGVVSPTEIKGAKTSMETGRVEGGEESNQYFHQVSKDFESFTAYTYTYHLLPTSAKVHTQRDLRTYCTECGSRLRKGKRYCGDCGTKA